MKIYHPKQRPTKAGRARPLNPTPGPNHSINRMHGVSVRVVWWVTQTVFPVLVFPFRGFSLWVQRLTRGLQNNVNTLKSWLCCGCSHEKHARVWIHNIGRLLIRWRPLSHNLFFMAANEVRHWLKTGARVLVFGHGGDKALRMAILVSCLPLWSSLKYHNNYWMD